MSTEKTVRQGYLVFQARHLPGEHEAGEVEVSPAMVDKGMPVAPTREHYRQAMEVARKMLEADGVNPEPDVRLRLTVKESDWY